MSLKYVWKPVALAISLSVLAGCAGSSKSDGQNSTTDSSVQTSNTGSNVDTGIDSTVNMDAINGQISNIGLDTYSTTSVDGIRDDILNSLDPSVRNKLTAAQQQEIINEIKKMQRMKAREIFFDFDKYAIKSKFQSVLANHATYLADNPNTRIRLEGHADERGTPEYNIALGEKRAKAIAKIFMSYGVSKSQIEVISFGEERPAVMGHNESAWSKNRRVEIKY
jgi:peptidoglycan-associated lipoprotein